MLFPSDYPELQSAPTSPMTNRIAIGALAIALSITGLGNLADNGEPTELLVESQETQIKQPLG